MGTVMPVSLLIYRFCIECLGLIAPALFRRRIATGKENPATVSHRFAANLTRKPNLPVIWLHGASLGECQLNLALSRELAKAIGKPVCFVFTCQTRTAAKRLQAEFQSPFPNGAICLQQMAPLDTLRISRKFLDHWQPVLAIFSEGEVWPNLLRGLKKRHIPAFLINARMTIRSLRTWRLLSQSTRRIFSAFDHVLCSDQQTFTGLKPYLSCPAECTGNLKYTLPPPDHDPDELKIWRTGLAERPVLLAASTHAPEEHDLLGAFMQLNPRPFLILAPRHPDRGDQLYQELCRTGLNISRRTRPASPAHEADILLADTIGEMGLWYQLADTVYIGGGHARGVGGHNPLEALQLGKAVMTGPLTFNFQDMIDRLSPYEGLTVLENLSDLGQAYPPPRPSHALIEALKEHAQRPMQKTVQPILSRLESMGIHP